MGHPKKTLMGLYRLKNTVLMSGRKEQVCSYPFQCMTGTEGMDVAPLVMVTFQMWYMLWVLHVVQCTQFLQESLFCPSLGEPGELCYSFLVPWLSLRSYCVGLVCLELKPTSPNGNSTHLQVAEDMWHPTDIVLQTNPRSWFILQSSPHARKHPDQLLHTQY